MKIVIEVLDDDEFSSRLKEKDEEIARLKEKIAVKSVEYWNKHKMYEVFGVALNTELRSFIAKMAKYHDTRPNAYMDTVAMITSSFTTTNGIPFSRYQAEEFVRWCSL